MSSSTSTTKKKRSGISVPSSQTTISIIILPPVLLDTYNILHKNIGQFINTYELRDAGITSVSQSINRLIAKGAVIDVMLKNATDSTGKVHKRVAHYRFWRWL